MTEEEAHVALVKLKEVIASNMQRVLNLFQAWDTNGDKCVDRKEFAKAIKDLGFEFPKSTIHKLFDYLDDDGRGTLDYQEMRTALQAPIKSFAKGKPVTKAAAKEAVAAAKADANAKAKAEAKAATKADAKAEAKTDAKVAAKVAAKAEAKDNGKAKAKTARAESGKEKGKGKGKAKEAAASAKEAVDVQAAASYASATDSSSAACFKPAEGASTVDVSALFSSVDEPTPPLPTGWFEAKSAEGKAYFFHAVTKQTVWERPAPPPEWLAWQKQQREWQEQAKRHGQWQQQQQQQHQQQQQQQQQQQPQTPQPPLGTSSSAPVTPPPQTSSAAPQPSPKRRGKPRRAKTARDLRTAAASATSREDSYWNKEYQPSALATDPLKCNPAGIRGWVDPDGIRRPERSLERRKLIPQVDIGYYEPNGRGAGVKEAGLPAISQAFKESLRSTYVEQFDKLEGSEASVENLRKMLAKAAGERLPLFEY
jgi:hypothetical protein